MLAGVSRACLRRSVEKRGLFVILSAAKNLSFADAEEEEGFLSRMWDRNDGSVVVRQPVNLGLHENMKHV